MNRSRRLDDIIGRALLISGVKSNDSASVTSKRLSFAEPEPVNSLYFHVYVMRICYSFTQKLLNGFG